MTTTTNTTNVLESWGQVHKAVLDVVKYDQIWLDALEKYFKQVASNLSNQKSSDAQNRAQHIADSAKTQLQSLKIPLQTNTADQDVIRQDADSRSVG